VFRFDFAGLPIELRAAHPGALDDLGPVYAGFATTAAPLLTIEVTRVPGFDRERGPEYPAFARRVLPDGRLRVERFDAEGEIAVGPLPLTAQFRIGPSPNSLEACLRIAASLALPRTRALILHASAVVEADRALVFTGVSGAGKSTISTMLADAYPACRKIADELLVLRAREAGEHEPGWQVIVPPYLGPAGVAHGATAPLAGIHVLVQANHDTREPLAPVVALRELLRHVLVYIAEPRTADHVLALAAEVAAAVPCYRLHFRKDPYVGRLLELTPAASVG
jgi:hypothetical protein